MTRMNALSRRDGRRAAGAVARGSGALLASLLLLTSVPQDSLAQRRGERRAGPDRAEMQRRIQARFGQIVRQQLGLDAGEQEELARVLREAEARRRELERREAALRARLRSQATLVPRQGPQPLLEEEQAREVLAEMRELREEELRLFLVEAEGLLHILTPSQLVRFYALREQLAHRIRGLRQPRGGGGPPRGPGFPPGAGGR